MTDIVFLLQTLNLLSALCDQYGYSHCRLDGNTPSTRRVNIVNEFNSPHSTYCEFYNSLLHKGGVWFENINICGKIHLDPFDYQ